MLFLVAQIFFLLLLATALGLFAGWLIWGGVKASAKSGEPSTLTGGPVGSADTTAVVAERDAAVADLEARTGDVQRLRRKLKRAVEELEAQADQLEAAEEKIVVLSGSPEAAALLAASGPTSAEVQELRQRMTSAEAANATMSTDLFSLQAEHETVNRQLTEAVAKVQTLTNELETARTGATMSPIVSADTSSATAAELEQTRRSAKEATERVAYLEQQALLWQNEADRVHAELDSANRELTTGLNKLPPNLP
jgi:chromosome segregation ATPase